MDTTDVLVVGAGVVGLAIARALAQAGLDVIVIEREGRYGAGVSSRNSEVIHAGLHGAAGSLKARLCVRGKALLYEFCESHHVDHRRCGKLLVANGAAEEAKLHALMARAQGHGVADLQLLDSAQARRLEPAVACTAALLSPSSGIVDSHGLMTALLGDAQAHGALLACHSSLAAAHAHSAGWRVRVATGPQTEPDTEPFDIHTRWLVNAAGLQAQTVAAAIEGFPAAAIPRQFLAKGHYFSLAGRAPFQRLIYPLPADGGLGVHLTLDLGGQARFGPDVQWLDDAIPFDPTARSIAAEETVQVLNYNVDASRIPAFESAVRSYWPGLPAGAMTPAYSGIRPKLSGPGQAEADFRIDGPAQHGCKGVMQLYGIESPGLTACLAIADQVAEVITLH